MSVKPTRSKAVSKRVKPAKPRSDFPLYPHAVGKWAKTIRGKTYYFGVWDDPEGALRDYLDQKDDLYAGRTPGTKGGLTVRDVCNKFMVSKRIDLDAERLAPQTFCGYDKVCRRLIDQLGGNRSVSDLGPVDFEKLYAHLTRKHGIGTLGREITCTRSVFKYAYESDLLDKPIKFGPRFKSPSKNDLRKAKAKSERSNGKKLFAADELRRMIDVARHPLRTVILLGINGGMGNTDCASLPLSAFDPKGGWLDYPRPKTGVDRRIPLWPETVAAMLETIATRREPTDPADTNVVFLTAFRQRWVRYGIVEEKSHGHIRIKAKFDDAIAKAFGKLLDGLNLRRPGIGFYALRHTFETIAGGSRDQVAVDAIMGHTDNSMASIYRHGVDDARMRAVVDHVHGWLFCRPTKKLIARQRERFTDESTNQL